MDYSKNKIDDTVLALLLRLVRPLASVPVPPAEPALEHSIFWTTHIWQALDADVPGMIERMFSGVRVNTSEQKPALHTAFRDRTGKPVVFDGEDIQASVGTDHPFPILCRFHAVHGCFA